MELLISYIFSKNIIIKKKWKIKFKIFLLSGFLLSFFFCYNK